MKATILDGRSLANEILASVYQQVKLLKKKPSLAVILIGDNPASKLYIKLKEKASKKVDINFNTYYFSEDSEENEIIKTIEFLNKDDDIDAILVQLPLAKQFNTDKIISSIDPKKDVDGFHPLNKKNYLENKKIYIIPGLNLAVLHLLESSGENLENKTASIIVNNKEVFGKSLAKTLNDEKIKAEIYNWDEFQKNKTAQKANIIIIAVGHKHILTSQYVKENSIVIDLGINKDKNKVYGDVDTRDLLNKAKAISPVPGGIGPMTVAFLLENTLNLALQNRDDNK